MSERFQKLFALSENLYVSGSPIIIVAGALQKDTQTDNAVAQLKLKNVENKPVKALTVTLRPYDIAGEPLGDPVEFDYLDLELTPGKETGSKVPIILPDNKTRSFAVAVSKVVFFDNSIWKSSDSNEKWEPLPRTVKLADQLKDVELVKEYRLKFGMDSIVLPQEHLDIWQCKCGQWCKGAACQNCKAAKEAVLPFSLQQLEEAKDLSLYRETKEREAKEAALMAEREAKAAARTAQKEATAKKVRKALPYLVIAAVVCIVALLLVNKVIIPNNEFKKSVDATVAEGIPAEIGVAAKRKDAEALCQIGAHYDEGDGVPQDYKKAMEWYQKAAELGNSEAVRNIGLLYDLGNGVDQDYNEAMQWYFKAAELGNAAAMRNIGFLYENGNGVDQDYSEAMQWYQKAAELGNSEAMRNIGLLYDNGNGVDQDYNEAMQWYQKAAELGNSEAMRNIGLLYDNGNGVDQNYGEAMQWYQKSAELGDSEAMRNIGLLYDNGNGVDQNYGEAMQWYQKSAELGNAAAMRNIGFLYQYGYGVGKDYNEAMKWYQKSAELGNAAAMRNIGFLYQYGYGVGKDYNEAMKWYQKAAELGNTNAMINLGFLYYFEDAKEKAFEWWLKAAELGNVNGMTNVGNLYADYYKDYEKAMEWWLKAVELGSASAMHNIGNSYEKGWGVEKNLDEANKWYQKAEEAGYTETP